MYACFSLQMWNASADRIYTVAVTLKKNQKSKQPQNFSKSKFITISFNLGCSKLNSPSELFKSKQTGKPLQMYSSSNQISASTSDFKIAKIFTYSEKLVLGNFSPKASNILNLRATGKQSVKVA